MKIAYLLYTNREFDECVETVKQLVMQGDHAFIMVNDNELRDELYFAFAESDRIHISHTQEYAQEGDLSLARGTIIQMKEAVELEGVNFDYYINLSDGMIPIKTRDEIIEYLEKNPDNHYYIDHDNTTDEILSRHVNSYYFLTNLLSFPTSKFVRFLSKGGAKVYYSLHIRKKNTDKFFIGSPYFILNHKSATILANNFDYVSETFKLSWYAEEMYIPTMLNKFLNLDHINDDLRIIGKEGKWIPSSGITPTTLDTINNNPKALFAGQILVDENPSLYADYFDIYNKNFIYTKEKEDEKDIDPERIKEAIEKARNQVK